MHFVHDVPVSMCIRLQVNFHHPSSCLLYQPSLILMEKVALQAGNGFVEESVDLVRVGQHTGTLFFFRPPWEMGIPDFS
jgi:hypothetical protein